MLYMLGTLTIDTQPFSINRMDRSADATIATKAVIGSLQPKEFMGEGEEEITLTGQILPWKLGGMDELATLDEMRRTGTRFPLLRGDGWRPGWYVITKFSEAHTEIMRDGVGFIVEHRITMVKTQADAGAGQQVISGLLSLFSAL